MDTPAEFRLIRDWLSGMDTGPGVVFGIGDDAAVLAPPPDRHLVMTVDTLVSGTHFPADAPPRDVGHRALAVNLSDLAAMGAGPLWALLALTLPTADERWLAGFAAGFRALAAEHGLALVGGNLSRGPLSATVQLTGQVPTSGWLSRHAARPGDLLLVSGTLGDGAGGLAVLQTQTQTQDGGDAMRAWLIERYLRPSPRVALGQAALGVAHAAIDISDGLLADLGHVCRASGCGARLRLDALPLSPALLACHGRERGLMMALQGGDDYELLLACPPAALPLLSQRALEVACPLQVIGECVAGEGVELLDAKAQPVDIRGDGFRHF